MSKGSFVYVWIDIDGVLHCKIMKIISNPIFDDWED
jgi:hypothetical protein